MGRILVTVTLLLTICSSSGKGQTLQTALNNLGYSINVAEDVIPGELFFQKMSSDASIVFQESSHLYIEALGWYNEQSGPNWLIGGAQTGFPMIAQLPVISGTFGFVMHPNFTGTGYLTGIWYSQSSLNSDIADHVRVFPVEINGVRVPYSYILAWEDLDHLGDADYQDMIVKLTGVEAITPEPSPTQLVNLVQWKLEDGGNGHWYAVLASSMFWPQARDYVAALSQGGVAGHLATVTSIKENTFIFNNVTAGLHNPSILDEYFMGGYYDQGSWSWITDEPFLFTNWSPGEPNNDPETYESRVSMWGPNIEGWRVPGMWNNLPPSQYTFWSLVEWDVPLPAPAPFTINGEVSVVSVGTFAGVEIRAFDFDGNPLGSAVSDVNGYYELNLPSGVIVNLELQVPLGFSPTTPALVHLTPGGNWTVPFTLTTQTTGKVADYWWWKRQMEDIHNCVSTGYGGMTRDEFNTLGQRIFEHFYLKSGGYAIMIEGLTYTGAVARAMSFDDIYNTFFAIDKETNPGKTKAHLLAVLLNVASGRLSQLAKVSKDNANASQAITHYAELYHSGWNDWTYWYNIMKIHCPSFGIIPSGIIPLTTPVILYKVEGLAGELPQSPLLAQNYPNPFNPSTEINFTIPTRGHASVEVFNSLGQRLATLVDREMEPGNHRVSFDGGKYSSGVYYYRLTANDQTTSKKMMLIK